MCQVYKFKSYFRDISYVQHVPLNTRPEQMELVVSLKRVKKVNDIDS